MDGIVFDLLGNFPELDIGRFWARLAVQREDKSKQDEDETENNAAEQCKNYFEFIIIHKDLQSECWKYYTIIEFFPNRMKVRKFFLRR